MGKGGTPSCSVWAVLELEVSRVRTFKKCLFFHGAEITVELRVGSPYFSILSVPVHK